MAASVEARISLIKLEFSSCLFANSLINLLRVSSIVFLRSPIIRIHQGIDGVSMPALTKDHKGIKLNTPYPEKTNTPYWKYGMNIIFWKISSVVPTTRNPQYAVSNPWIRHVRVVLFYNGLDVPTRQILDSRGSIPSKIVVEAKVAIPRKGPHYTKDCPLKEEGKTLEEAYYTQFGGPFQGGGYRATAPGYYQRNNANPSYQERRQSMEDTLSKFMSESAKRHEENSNLIKEI
ncbi:hypothetical protein Tco_0888632 [Tanacetum coccineum]